MAVCQTLKGDQWEYSVDYEEKMGLEKLEEAQPHQMYNLIAVLSPAPSLAYSTDSHTTCFIYLFYMSLVLISIQALFGYLV